jgi:coronin-1B/1C/6
MRAYKTVNDSYIEPISFTVPRRAEVFQADIYPPATGSKPGVSAADWLSGKSAIPPKIDLESVYEGNAPVEVPADYKPPKEAPAPVAAPAKAASPTKKEPELTTQPTQTGLPPTMSQQKGSIAAMANKFQDDKEDSEDDDDETSSFEEIAKPVVRSTPAAAKAEPKPSSPVTARAPASTPSVSQATPRSTEPAASPKPTTIPTSSGPITAVGSPPPSTSNGSVEASLAQITRLLEQQNKTLAAQSEKISSLTAEVDSLKKKVGGGNQDQSERIRQLELELEEARS